MFLIQRLWASVADQYWYYHPSKSVSGNEPSQNCGPVTRAGNPSVQCADTCLFPATSSWKTDPPAPSTSWCPAAITRDQRNPFLLAGTWRQAWGPIQNNSWTWNTLEISSKSSPLCFAGSVHLQCCPDDSAHNGELRFPEVGPRGWLVHGFVFYGADTRLYGIYVSNPERLLKTGKSLFFLTACLHLAG